MAKAPTPGVGKRMNDSAALKEALSSVVTIRCERDDKTLSFSMGDIKSWHEMSVRKATGFNLMNLIASDQIGWVEVLVLWWVALSLNDETTENCERFLDGWSFASFMEAGFSSPEVEADSGDDSPEA